MTALSEMRIRVGGDPRGYGEFTALRDELAKLTHPACPDVDWAKVEQLCQTLFHNNGAELQTAASFALARSQRHGLEGMTQGVVLIEALCREWPNVWPPMATVRLDILAWLFAQMQPLLRSLQINTQTLPGLVRLDNELERLNTQLDHQAQVPLVTLQRLRRQVGVLILRLERKVSSGEMPSQATGVPEPARVIPVMILPADPMPESTLRRLIPLWLFAVAAMVALASGIWWWGGSDSWLIDLFPQHICD